MKHKFSKILAVGLTLALLISMLVTAVPVASAVTDAEILTYSLPGQTGDTVINSTAGTIAVTVPFDTDVTNPLAATFTASLPRTSITVGGTPQVSETTENDFTGLVVYVVTAENGTTAKTWTVTVTVFYDKKVTLNPGWTLFSTDNYIISSGDNTSAWIGTPPTLIYRHTGEGYVEYGDTPDSAFAVLTPVEALYVKMPDGGFVGLNYSDVVPFPSSKDLVEGWNLVGSATTDNASAVFSPLRHVLIDGQQAIGLSTIVAQGSYNTIGDTDFNEPALTDTHWTALASVGLKPFDGYWVYMYADTTFSVIPGVINLE